MPHQFAHLPMQEGSGRAVAPVNLLVAVVAAPARRVDHRATTAARGLTVRITGLPVARAVALQAKPWARHLERGLVDRAVRIMAVHAVFAHGEMLEQERSALLGMALVASVIDRIRLQERRA